MAVSLNAWLWPELKIEIAGVSSIKIGASTQFLDL
jgi:hypothetical protein